MLAMSGGRSASSPEAYSVVPRTEGMVKRISIARLLAGMGEERRRLSP